MLRTEVLMLLKAGQVDTFAGLWHIAAINT